MRPAGAALAWLGLAAAACRSSLVEIQPLQTRAAPAASPVPLPTLPAPAPATVLPAESGYAVVWAQESLAVRQPAGITSSQVASLSIDQRGIAVTGQSTLLGSSTWLEIFLPEGGTGWVNAYNLTEDVSTEAFCQDPRPVELANRFIQAVQTRAGLELGQLASPRRGLIIRHDWWNPEVVIDFAELPRLFIDPTERDWGTLRDSGLTIRGSFAGVILPQLLEVFEEATPYSCNEIVTGSSSEASAWPPEYTNLNLLSFHRAAPSPLSLNWRTWALGIEYVDGNPYLAVLVQYRGEI